jgi:transitional endoplasmic reticulum ATPase
MVELPLKHPEIFEKLGIEPPRGVLLHGTPGTGKTMLAKAVANESDANFILINGPELMSKFYGESEKNLREKFEEAEKSAPSIIFIDEIDAIASKREEAVGEVERRVVSQMLTLMDGLQSRGKVIVIGATNRPNALDPALRRPGRFDREITINVPDKKGRLSILKIHTRNMPLTKDVNLEEFAEVTHGFVGADISSLAKEAAMNVLRRVLPQIKMDEDKEISKEVLESLQVTKKDFQEALKIVRPSAMREVLVETPNVKWSDVGGLDIAKQELKEAIEWPMRNPAVFERMGIKPPRGILTYGPPGTGKTLLAKAIANESGANFILVKGPELLSMWVGKSEEGVRKIFERARQVAPCIIFFDEIDSLAARRGADMGSRVGDQVLNQILAEIDGLEELRGVVVVGATNRPDMLDPALLRPGRFDRLLLVTPPDKKGRLEIFKIHTRNMPVMEEKLSKELDIVLKGLSLRLLEKELSELSLDLKKNRKEFDILVEYKNVISSFIKVPNNGIQEEKEEKITKKEDKNYNFRKLIGLLMDIDKEKQKTIGELADKAEGYVGADIEGVCREAALLTLRDDLEAKEVKKKYFEKAMNKVKASVTKESMDKYRRMEDEYLKSAKSALEKEVRYLG